MVWDTIVGTILGGLISGLIGIFMERYRRYLELRDKHFNEIKEKCLEPILQNLSEMKNRYFGLGEVSTSPNLSEIESIIEDETRHWWKHHSLAAYADRRLYEDLSNHYKELYDKIEEVQRLFQQNIRAL